jgi:hypothetical protein
MTKTLGAIYDGKSFNPDEPVDLEPNTHVTITIEIPAIEIPIARNQNAEDIDPVEALFGSIALGYPLGTDNDGIDKDLAGECSMAHK